MHFKSPGFDILTLKSIFRGFGERSSLNQRITQRQKKINKMDKWINQYEAHAQKLEEDS